MRHQFIKSLPNSIAVLIASYQDLPLTKLGKMADDLIPYLNSQQHCDVLAVSTEKSSSYSPEKYRSSLSNGSHKGLLPFKPDQRQKVRRFHLFYGTKANRCTLSFSLFSLSLFLSHFCHLELSYLTSYAEGCEIGEFSPSSLSFVHVCHFVRDLL